MPDGERALERPALILTCEHASNALPPGLDLGVPRSVLDSHVAWDPGAAEVAAALADRTGALYLAGRYSRLVVDLNRSEDRPEVVPAVAFGVPVPGNARLGARGRAARIDEHWRPHREAVRRAVAETVAAAGACLHLAVHSFDPTLDPAVRGFDVGVLFDPARLFERLVVDSLVRALGVAGFAVRENEPYAGTDDGLTTALRLEFPDGSYAGIELELSQALLRRPADGGRVAAAVADWV